MVANEGEILDFSAPNTIFQHILCKTYDESLQKQVANMHLQCILCIANSSYAVKTPKDEVTCGTYWNFYKQIENFNMFPSKREISRSNGRTADNLSTRESPVQNGTVVTYEYLFYDWFPLHFVLICSISLM